MSFLSTRKIGVIGYGMFGKFLCDELLKELNIAVYSAHSSNNKLCQRVTFTKTLQQLAQNSDFIIPAVPISKFEKVIREITPHLNKNMIIMDICSVKSYPVQIMQKLLPDSVQKIATHPMFGPSSFTAKGTISGLPMVMYNAGCKKTIYQKVRQHFTKAGLQIIEITPEEHDIITAKSQFFSQLVRSSAQMQNIHPTLIDTPGASILFEAFNLMNISEQLLIDMLNYNIHAQKILIDTIASLNQIKNKAEKIKKHETYILFRS